MRLREVRMVIKDIKDHIVVVGAGISGLTAAYRLQQAGCNVDVYEARQRPGGRILSVKLGDRYEEMGGKNFLDAGEPFHSLKLIRDLNLETNPCEKPFSWWYLSDNKLISYLEILRKFKSPLDLWKTLEEVASRSKNLQEVIDILFEKNSDLHVIFTQAMATWEGCDPEILDPSCVDGMYQTLTNSFKRLRDQDAGRTDVVKWLSLKGGNAQLPLALSEKLHGQIHYGAILKAVQRRHGKIVLTFNDNQEVVADKVLLTIPCPVFQDIDFEADVIPEVQLSHIRNMQYGTNSKILIPVKVKDKRSEVIISHRFVSWLNEDHKVVTLYMGGQQGLIDKTGAQALLEEGASFIKKFYGDDKVKGMKLETAQEAQLSFYKGAVFKNWATDAFAKGSYSTRGIGQAAVINEMSRVEGEEVRTLFHPVEDQIFFAGEHTTTLSALGTLEGAIESGERMARLILKNLI